MKLDCDSNIYENVMQLIIIIGIFSLVCMDLWMYGVCIRGERKIEGETHIPTQISFCHLVDIFVQQITWNCDGDIITAFS